MVPAEATSRGNRRPAGRCDRRSVLASQDSDPAAALRATFADQSLLRGGSTPPQSPVAESIPTLDGPPDPDDASKPESPTDLSKPSILYVLRRTAREFSTDQCTDLAAALTYYAVL